MRTSERLARQNNLKGWRDCVRAGLTHRPIEVQRVGDARYIGCERCPVVIRRTR